MPYFHFVFALPAVIGAMAYQNKAKVYGLLFKAAAETSPLSPPIASTSVPRSASSPSCTHGHKTSITIRMCTAPFRVAASRRMASVGLLEGPHFLLPVLYRAHLRQ